MVSSSDMHEETYRQLEVWLERLRQVDRLLKPSVSTLVDIAEWAMKRQGASMPLFINDRSVTSEKFILLVHAVATSTIQRIYKGHRRFAWLDRRTATLRELNEEMPRRLEADKSADRTSLEFLRYAANDLFGALNPVTSSELFWAFIRAGEGFAHSGVGFLTFFGMLWSLSRRYPDETQAGAALEPSGPTTGTTAKCLIAIRGLLDALQTRGRLFRDAADLLPRIDGLAGKRGPHATWQFTFELDLLAGKLFELSVYTINDKEFVAAGEDLLALTAFLRADSETSGPWIIARERLRRLLQDLELQQRKVFADAAAVVDELFPEIIACLKPGGPHEDLLPYCHKLATTGTDEYWADHARAADRARKVCADALRTLLEPFNQFDALPPSGSPPTDLLVEILAALSRSNLRVAEEVDESISDSVRWCRRAINEEIALGSARNWTEFDPVGLISGVAIAQKWDQISRPEAEDAIRHSLEGALSDGSWNRGQPIFLQERVLGVWPTTPDIVLMLVTAVNAEPEITVADEKIIAFVDWLERTMMQFLWREGGIHVAGWSSELDREPNIIDFWNTSVSINALFEIRQLIETRIWHLCQRRFTILPHGRMLRDVAPVDLGALHEKRLHRRLMKMARWSELEDKYDQEDYSIVLHGPPGSSKTAVVEGLGTEMWKGIRHAPRIIRITPADFIRQGEDRLDSEARMIFELIGHVRGVTILFDEIDDFLRQRIAGEELRFLKLIVPAMLNRLQDLRDTAPRQEICFVIATNFVDKIEPALLRPGRIDSVVPVTYPDAFSREAILEQNAGKLGLARRQIDEILEQTVAWPWSTFNRMTKELGRKGDLITFEQIRTEIERARDQVQGSNHYYYDATRWQKPCAALASEFVHLTFCRSKEAAKCRDEVMKLVDWLEKHHIHTAEHRIPEMFDRQSAAQQRNV